MASSYSPAAYSNVSMFPSASKRSGLARKTAALADRSAETEIKAKIERANEVLNRLEFRANAQAEVIKAMGKRKAATLAKIARIEDAILSLMDDAGLKTINGIRCSMSQRPAAESLEVIDEKLIPQQFFNTPKTPPATVDKVAVKKALAADSELDPLAWGVKLTAKISLIRK